MIYVVYQRTGTPHNHLSMPAMALLIAKKAKIDSVRHDLNS